MEFPQTALDSASKQQRQQSISEYIKQVISSNKCSPIITGGTVFNDEQDSCKPKWQYLFEQITRSGENYQNMLNMRMQLKRSLFVSRQRKM